MASSPNESSSVSSDKSSIKEQTKKVDPDFAYRIKAGVFLSCAAGFGLLFGFGGALAAAKKQDPDSFDKGLLGLENSKNGHPVRPPKPSQAQLHASGAALASKALLYGSLYAVAGVGLISFGIWKLSGASNFQEFRAKVAGVLPVVPKNSPPQGRTEFSGINDLLQYLIDEDKRSKEEKANKKD